MISFLMFNWIMAITPGPNTIMALSEGQVKGFRRSLIYNFGSFVGFWLVGGAVALLSTKLLNQPGLTLVMKLVGSGYLAYLAIHSLRGSQAIAAGEGLAHPFTSALLLQATNVKVYLYYVAGLGGFTAVFATTNGVWLKLLVMVMIGAIGTLIWSVVGHYLKTFYNAHATLVNWVVALLLVVSIVDLWR